MIYVENWRSLCQGNTEDTERDTQSSAVRRTHEQKLVQMLVLGFESDT